MTKAVQRVIGVVAMILAGLLYFNSMKMTTESYGWLSGGINGMLGGGRGGMMGFLGATSMAIVWIPLALGVFALFYDHTKRWAHWLTYIGLGIVIVDSLSHVRFVLPPMTSLSFLTMLGLFVFGLAMMAKAKWGKDTATTATPESSKA